SKQANRHAQPANAARRKHILIWRLCRLHMGGSSWSLRPAARAGGAPAGRSPRQANEAATGRQAAAALALSRFWLARFARRVLDGWHPDRRTPPPEPLDRATLRAPHAPLGLRDE